MLSYLFAAAGAVAVPAIIIARRPADFRIERSVTIQTSAGALFPLLSDFKQWRNWSPWEELDPQLERNYSGAPHGRGAIYEWAGKKAGRGRMEIVDARQPEQLSIDLQFIAPFKAQNQTVFTVKSAESGVEVRWQMRGTRKFMMKAFSLFADLDKLVGGDFEKGLARLKQLAEQGAAPAAE